MKLLPHCATISSSESASMSPLASASWLTMVYMSFRQSVQVIFAGGSAMEGALGPAVENNRSR